ncbi:MAG TPA: hypothetical protein VJZ32_06685 [Candidatus Bathyarchaeia archaeon]|nr:hypothetical protein [Candidatus Bathyarchaeia archaeon]
MKQNKCEACGIRPALKDDILCQECCERYETILQSANKGNVRSAEITPSLTSTVESRGQVTQTLLEPIPAETLSNRILEKRESQRDKRYLRRRRSSQLAGYFLLGIGLVALIVSVSSASTILAFVGLGLSLWGVLALFIQPEKYVASNLMNATALSSMKTIDTMMMGLGYRERGVYIPSADGSSEAVVFVPSEPFSLIPQSSAIEGKSFLKDPQGLLVVPPGLALSTLIEKKFGFNVKNCGLEKLVQALPKALVELEIVRDVEIKVVGDHVDFTLFDSIYSDFCRQIRDKSRPCALGCPMCSALACILAVATGKPVMFEEDKLSGDKNTSMSSYRIISGQRL